MTTIDQLQKLKEQKDNLDEDLLEGLRALKEGLKGLGLGIPMSLDIHGVGILTYEKMTKGWDLMLDNSKYSHAETKIPLLSCSKQVRAAVIQKLPVFLLQAVAALQKDLQERVKAKQALIQAKDILNTLKSI